MVFWGPPILTGRSILLSGHPSMKKLTIKAMKGFAEKRGGRCISARYANSHSPLMWECVAGHRWSATPQSIVKGSWCPECAGVRQLTLEQMQKLAETRGGRCLSECYLNGAWKLMWRCSKGHKWSAAASQIRKGHWCPFCAGVARLTLSELQRDAARKGGQCLSLEYVNSSQFLSWKCNVGHEWQARASSIRAGRWCPACAHNQKLNLREMQEIARERGGKCLSSRYENGRTPLMWECELGHHWRALPARVKNGLRRKGTWCPKCYSLRRRVYEKHGMEGMRDLAIARGGKCLSTEYSGSKSKLQWQCAHGHRWPALPSSIIQGSWCPTCARNQRLTLAQFQDFAVSKGGACLSQTYINGRTYLAWRCAEGHLWNATPAKVKQGSWCPTCATIRGKNRCGPQGTNNFNDSGRATTGMSHELYRSEAAFTG